MLGVWDKNVTPPQLSMSGFAVICQCSNSELFQTWNCFKEGTVAAQASLCYAVVESRPRLLSQHYLLCYPVHVHHSYPLFMVHPFAQEIVLWTFAPKLNLARPSLLSWQVIVA